MNNIYNFSNKFTLFSLLQFLSYWLLYIGIIVLLFNVLDYDSSVVYCDSANSSISPFFVEDTSDKSISNSSISNDANCSNTVDKYKNVGKRHVYWYLFEKGKGNYTSYKEYKKSWNPDINILSEAIKLLNLEVEYRKHRFSVAKRSLSWFFKGSKPGGGRF
jgi:hypothetical protein